MIAKEITMANTTKLVEHSPQQSQPERLTEEELQELYANDQLLSAVGTAKGLWEIDADGNIAGLHEGWD
jgi:hypothetical protein